MINLQVTGTILGSVYDGSRGDDSSVGNDDNWPLELALEVFSDLLTDLAKRSERAEKSANQDDFENRTSQLVFDLLSRVDVNETQVKAMLEWLCA